MVSNKDIRDRVQAFVVEKLQSEFTKARESSDISMGDFSKSIGFGSGGYSQLTSYQYGIGIVTLLRLGIKFDWDLNELKVIIQ